MNENTLIDFLIQKNSIFKFILFYIKLKKQRITYDLLLVYYDFINCIERIFYYNNSIDSVISTHMDESYNKYIIISKKEFQAYISLKDNKDMSIRIHRNQGHKIASTININYDEFNKIKRYDRYVIDYIFNIVKHNILILFKNYYKNTK